MDFQRLTGSRRLHEFADDATVGVLRALAGSVDVGVPQDGDGHVVDLVERLAVVLSGRLAGGVSAQAFQGRVFGNWQARLVAVDGRGRRVDETLDIRPLRGEEHIQGAPGVHVEVPSRVGVGLNDVSGRAMNHVLLSMESRVSANQPLHHLVIGD